MSIAKNYLDETELDGLNRIVSMYLDFAEMQANNRKIMYMKLGCEIGCLLAIQ